MGSATLPFDEHSFRDRPRLPQKELGKGSRSHCRSGIQVSQSQIADAAILREFRCSAQPARFIEVADPKRISSFEMHKSRATSSEVRYAQELKVQLAVGAST
jgi:hypothetical protein